jgi:nicotinamide mononucleotide transporter
MLDFFGTVFSLLATYCFIKRNNLAWVLSIVAILLNSWLYFIKGIYAHMWLESYYLITSIYGLYFWAKDKQSKSPSISIKSLTSRDLMWLFLFISVSFLCLSSLLVYFTNSNIPYIDALTTVLSILGQFLMCKQYITAWIIWLITDSLYIIVYYKKQLPFHIVLMLIYTMMAIAGYLRWSKERGFVNQKITLEKLQAVDA